MVCSGGGSRSACGESTQYVTDGRLGVADTKIAHVETDWNGTAAWKLYRRTMRSRVLCRSLVGGSRVPEGPCRGGSGRTEREEGKNFPFFCILRTSGGEPSPPPPCASLFPVDPRHLSPTRAIRISFSSRVEYCFSRWLEQTVATARQLRTDDKCPGDVFDMSLVTRGLIGIN